jgi:hypothetical protein
MDLSIKDMKTIRQALELYHALALDSERANIRELLGRIKYQVAYESNLKLENKQ